MPEGYRQGALFPPVTSARLSTEFGKGFYEDGLPVIIFVILFFPQTALALDVGKLRPPFARVSRQC